MDDDDWQRKSNDSAARPGDESLACGGLISRCCRRGRDPFVVVLTDGSTMSALPDFRSPDDLATLHERETRTAVQCLGLPARRLLMAGLFDGTIPADGPAFDAVVRGIMLVMWARDCNVICAPSVDDAIPDRVAANRIAFKVAERSCVGLVCYQTSDRPSVSPSLEEPNGLLCLDITAERPAKRAAILAHASGLSDMSGKAAGLRPYEAYRLLPTTSEFLNRRPSALEPPSGYFRGRIIAGHFRHPLPPAGTPVQVEL